MKNIAVAFTLLAAVAAFATGKEVIKRGAAIAADAKAISVATVLEKPSDYTKDAVVVEGVIAKSCTTRGCWMQLASAAGKPGVRVTFKDYGFFIPLDAQGMSVRAEGVAVVKKLSKEDTDHLIKEGASLVRNEDGTANEVSFVANGVELRK
ncbi:MAG TPA: DUF4920 domain-containing protein [Thermoanaerobaculia bacterium]|jgi:hypothetical protein